MKNYSKNKYNRISNNDNIFMTNLDSDTRSILGNQEELESEKDIQERKLLKKEVKD